MEVLGLRREHLAAHLASLRRAIALIGHRMQLSSCARLSTKQRINALRQLAVVGRHRPPLAAAKDDRALLDLLHAELREPTGADTRAPRPSPRDGLGQRDDLARQRMHHLNKPELATRALVLLEGVARDVVRGLSAELTDLAEPQAPGFGEQIGLVDHMLAPTFADDPVKRKLHAEREQVAVWAPSVFAKLTAPEGAKTNRRDTARLAVGHHRFADAIKAAVEGLQPFSLRVREVFVVDREGQKLVALVKLRLVLASKGILRRLIHATRRATTARHIHARAQLKAGILSENEALGAHVLPSRNGVKTDHRSQPLKDKNPGSKAGGRRGFKPIGRDPSGRRRKGACQRLMPPRFAREAFGGVGPRRPMAWRFETFEVLAL